MKDNKIIIKRNFPKYLLNAPYDKEYGKYKQSIILLKLNEEKENNRIIKNQFTVLIVEEFGEYYRQGKDIQDIIDMLKIRMRAYRKNNGINYWVACLYDCLAGNPYALETMLKIA